MWYADPDKRPMVLTLAGTIIGLIILSLLWWNWHAPTEAQQVDSYKINAEGQLSPAQRSEPAVGNGQ
jgi:uncharacterized membrane protein